jgi:hypothetical protein
MTTDPIDIETRRAMNRQRGGITTGVSAPRLGATPMPSGEMDIETRRAYNQTPYWVTQGYEDPNKAGADMADQVMGLNFGPQGGKRNPYTDAIRLLQQRLAGGGYGASMDRLSTQLGSTATAAGGRIDEATARALESLRSTDPMAAYQYSATPTQIPQTALGTYLNSIGAGTASVDAGRQLLQGMIDAQTAQAGQYSSAAQQAFDLQRQAAQQALVGNQQYAQSQLAAYRQAQEMAIAQAKEAERKAIEDQILEYTLRGGRVR